MRDHCYLHGFIERLGGDSHTERFVAFFADDADEISEREAFAEAWAYMQASMPCGIYYYSKYERTIYRKLQEKYPDVCSADDIEALFDPATAVDLYFDVVLKATEWPTRTSPSNLSPNISALPGGILTPQALPQSSGLISGSRRAIRR